MKAKELRDLTDEELGQKAQDARAEIFNLRVQQSAGQLEKPSRMRDVRKDLARMETVRNQRAQQARKTA